MKQVGLMTAGNLFICHRRSDAVRQVGRLMQQLGDTYGNDALHYGSHLGAEDKVFCKEGLRAMIGARAVLIMIGPKWDSPDNLERLHEISGEPDLLRRWIALALSRHGTDDRAAPMLIPILFDGATLPDRASLPKDLKRLSQLAPLGFSSDETQWSAQYKQLQTYLDTALGIDPSSGPAWLSRVWKPLTQALTQLRR